MGVQIPVEAKLDPGEIEKVLQKLTEQMNRLGSAVAQANKVKFNPVSQATVQDLQKVTQQFDSLRKISGDLNKRLKETGQGGTGFFDIDWSRLYPDSSVRARQMRKQFEYVMAGTGASFTAPTPPPGSPPAPSPSPRPPAPPPSPGASWRQAGRNVVGAGLKAAGPVGGVADNALSAGMSGGIMAGLAGLAGGLLALGIGKAIGGVMSKVGDAQNDAIGYDTLKRQLGDVNVSFGMLRDSLHASSDAIDVTYAQVQKLGSEFAHISGISGDLSKTLAEEVRVGGGFGRSFGIDPGQSNAFFAQMRQFQVTNTEGDSRRLALYIGEAIAKSGTFAKTDEMLQAIASYTSQQTRLGLTTANVGDYSSMLAGLVGSHTPGLDPMGAANLLSRVNGAIAGGGGAGEAGQNFLYMAIGRQLGLDPIQASILREQGAFGTGAATFGQGSLYGQFAQKYGLSTPGTAAGSSATNLQMVMSRMQQVYAGRPELMLSAMSNLLGVNTSQAMALATIGPDKLGGLQQALGANGIDLTKMSSTGISALAQIATGDRATLNNQAQSLWKRLNPGEAKELDAAASGGTESLRSELLKLTAKYGQEETEGSQTRKSIQDLDKDMIDAAAKMIGPLNQMRDILLFAFGNRGSMTAADIHERVVSAQKKEANNRADARISKSRGTYEVLAGGLGEAASTPEGQQQLTDAYNNMQSETAAANKQRAEDLAKIAAENGTDTANKSAASGNSLPLPASLSGGGGSPGSGDSAFVTKYMPIAQEISQRTGISPRLVLAQLAVETGWGKKELAGSNNPFNIQKGSNWFGSTVSATDHRADGTPYTAQFRAYGNYDEAAGDYASLIARHYRGALNAGDNVAKFTGALQAGGYAESPDYAKSIADANTRLGTMLPDTSGAQSAPQNQSYTFNHNITLQYPNGQPAAAPVTITKQVTPPMAFGSN